MFAGVESGVRKDAAELTTTLMRTGREDTPISLAAEIAMGITISTVAVLLIN
jgi:hypothetical protein